VSAEASLPLVGVAGFRGYSGAELLRILGAHPSVRLVLLAHREDSRGDPRPLNHAPGQPQPPLSIPCTPEAVSGACVSLVFLATPHDVSMELAPPMLETGVRVIDLSGAFRLKTAERFERWYKEPHRQPELLWNAAYGLPEFCRASIQTARLISNPGCFPTAANLAIRPLIDAQVIDRACGIVCDAKSGVSGAGRKPSLKTSFCEVDENLSAYAVLEHRHVPEILMWSELEERELSFTTQLLPLDRGILETIYFRASALSSTEELLGIFAKRYANEPFIRVFPAGALPDLRQVNRTNFCDIGAVFDPPSGRAVVVVAIDNLVKGAAGQAIQNMNLAMGFPETAGLL
jgi:N-acetyl-gamma-glutamyl-phosphate reductase